MREKQELLNDARDLLLKCAVKKQMAEEAYAKARSLPWKRIFGSMKRFYTWMTNDIVEIIRELRA